MTLYYIPFAVETLVPVTEKDIRARAHYIIELDSQEQVAALVAVLSERKGKGRFDRHFVRLLLVPRSPPGADILVDSEGQVLEGSITSALTRGAFTSLKKMLSELTAGHRASDPEVIRRAKAIRVDKLDPSLPEMKFEEWVKELVGRGIKVEWMTGDCGLKHDYARPPEGHPLCADLSAEMPKGRLEISIRMGTDRQPVSGTPSVNNAWVVYYGRDGKIGVSREVWVTFAVWSRGSLGRHRVSRGF